jgi:hypothetical protein
MAEPKSGARSWHAASVHAAVSLLLWCLQAAVERQLAELQQQECAGVLWCHTDCYCRQVAKHLVPCNIEKGHTRAALVVNCLLLLLLLLQAVLSLRARLGPSPPQAGVSSSQTAWPPQQTTGGPNAEGIFLHICLNH